VEISLKATLIEIDPLEVLKQMDDAYHSTDAYEMMSALEIALRICERDGDNFDNLTVELILQEMAMLADWMLRHNGGLTDATRQRLEHIMADSGLFAEEERK
jgi:hypothetical protein